MSLPEALCSCADQFEPSTSSPSRGHILGVFVTVYRVRGGEFNANFYFGAAEFLLGFSSVFGVEEFIKHRSEWLSERMNDSKQLQNILFAVCKA